MGVSTTISPINEGSFDSSLVSGTAIRTTSLGSAPLGATVIHSQIDTKVPSTTHIRHHRMTTG